MLDDVSPFYRSVNMLTDIKLAYPGTVPSVQLQEFLTKDAVGKFDKNRKFKRVFIPDRASYEEAPAPDFRRFFGKDFAALISFICGRKVKLHSVSVRRFSARDYTLLHDRREPAGVDVYLDLTKVWDKDANGYISYVTKEGEALRLPAHYNALSIVTRSGSNRFLKYINHLAGKNNRTIVWALFK